MPGVGALGVVERDCVALRVDGEPVSTRVGISCVVPYLVDGDDILAEPAGAVLLGSAGGADLGGGAVGVANDEAAEVSLVVVFDAGQGRVEEEPEVFVVERANGYRTLLNRRVMCGPRERRRCWWGWSVRP